MLFLHPDICIFIRQIPVCSICLSMVAGSSDLRGWILEFHRCTAISKEDIAIPHSFWGHVVWERLVSAEFPSSPLLTPSFLPTLHWRTKIRFDTQTSVKFVVRRWLHQGRSRSSLPGKGSKSNMAIVAKTSRLIYVWKSIHFGFSIL